MVLSDLMLKEVAADFGADSFYLAFSNDTALEADTGATALSGEIGSRVACSVTIIDNRVFLSGVRAASLVVDTVNGDTLTGVALTDSMTDGQLFSITTLPSILHTINYDFDVDTPIDFERG